MSAQISVSRLMQHFVDVSATQVGQIKAELRDDHSAERAQEAPQPTTYNSLILSLSANNIVIIQEKKDESASESKDKPATEIEEKSTAKAEDKSALKSKDKPATEPEDKSTAKSKAKLTGTAESEVNTTTSEHASKEVDDNDKPPTVYKAAKPRFQVQFDSSAKQVSSADVNDFILDNDGFMVRAGPTDTGSEQNNDDGPYMMTSANMPEPENPENHAACEQAEQDRIDNIYSDPDLVALHPDPSQFPSEPAQSLPDTSNLSPEEKKKLKKLRKAEKQQPAQSLPDTGDLTPEEKKKLKTRHKNKKRQEKRKKRSDEKKLQESQLASEKHTGNGPVSSSDFDPAPSGHFEPNSSISEPASSGFEPAASGGFEPAASGGFEPATSGGFEPAPSSGFVPVATASCDTDADVDTDWASAAGEDNNAADNTQNDTTVKAEIDPALNLTFQRYPHDLKLDKKKHNVASTIKTEGHKSRFDYQAEVVAAEQVIAVRNLATKSKYQDGVYINPSIVLHHGNQHIPELHVVYQYGYKSVAGDKEMSEVVVRYWPDNLPRAQLAKPSQFFKITQLKSAQNISSVKNYPDLEVHMLEAALSQFGGYEIEMVAKPWSDTQNSYGHRTHLAGESVKHYGEHADFFQQLRTILDKPHIVRVILLATHDADATNFRRFYEDVKIFQANSYFNKWFKADQKTLIVQKGAILEPEHRPKIIVRSKLAFASHDEAVLVETFAQLAEHDHAANLSGKIPRLQARAMPTLGCDGKQLLLLVDRMSVLHSYERSDLKPLEAARLKQSVSALKAGDHVKVRIRALDLISDDTGFWHGTVVDDLSGLHLQDVVILINTPRNDKGEHIAIDLAPIQKSIIRFNELTTVERTSELLASRPAFLVDIHRNYDERPRKRTLHQMYQFKEAMYQQSEELMKDRVGSGPRLQGPLEIFALGSRPDLLRPKDILAGVQEAYITKLSKALSDSPGQLKVIEYIRSAPGGYALISGFAGAGKTFLLANIAAALCHGRRKSDSPAKIVIASPVNSNVDSIVDICTSVRLNALRMYTSTTEKQLAMLDLQLSNKNLRDDKAYSSEWQGIEDLFIAANCVKQLEANTARPLGINDKRVIRAQLHNTLPYKVLLACGLIDGHEAQQGEIYSAVKTAYTALAIALQRSRTIPDIGPRERDPVYKEDITTDLSPLRKTLGEAYKKVADTIVQAADVIVTTLALASEHRIVDVFKATHIMIDEASKAPSAETYGLMSHYRDAPVLFFGDILQTRPRSQASFLDSPFAAQLALSIFCRLLYLGFPSVHIAESQRFTQEYVDFVSPTFCKGDLVVAPKKAAYDASTFGQQDQALRAAILSTFEKGLSGKAVLGINISNTAQVTSGWNKTRHNLTSLSMVWVLLETLLEHETLRPGRIAILCYYQGQVTRHLNLRNGLIALAKIKGEGYLGRNPESLNDILISTVDKIQGGERDFIIIDAVATETPGVLQDASKMFTALTRGRQMAFFVYDYDAFQKMGVLEAKKSKTILNRVHSALQANKAIVNFESNGPIQESIYYKIAEICTERMARHVTDDAVEKAGVSVKRKPAFDPKVTSEQMDEALDKAGLGNPELQDNTTDDKISQPVATVTDDKTSQPAAAAHVDILAQPINPWAEDDDSDSKHEDVPESGDVHESGDDHESESGESGTSERIANHELRFEEGLW